MAQNARLYIGGIRESVPTEQLEGIFSKYGKIVDIKRNKFFSFVQYDNEKSAQSAIQAENGKTYFGKSLDVQIAKASSVNTSGNNSLNNSFHSDSPNKDRERFEMLNYGGPRGGGGGRGGGPRGGGRGGGNPGGDRFDSARDSPVGMGGPGDMMRGGVGGGRGGRGGFSGSPYGFDREDQPPPMRDNDFGPRDGPPPYRGGPPGGPPPRFRDEPPFRGNMGGPGAGPPRDGFGPGGRGGRDDSGPPQFGGGMRDGFPGRPGVLGDGPGLLPPPTHPPGPLATPHQQRTNDVEIIVISKNITDYGEMIEHRLKSLAFSVDLLFPNEEVPLPRVLSNIASRGTLYAILVTPVHQQNRSLTLNILHGSPQEHRNMLIEDAVTLISRNYEMYVMQCCDKQGPSKPPEDVRSIMHQRLLGNVPLSLAQVDKLISFFTQEKAKMDQALPGGGPMNQTGTLMTGMKGGPSVQEQDLQNRILNILNKGPSVPGGGPVKPPSMVAPIVGGPQKPVGPPSGGGGGGPKPPTSTTDIVGAGKPLLNDPSVQKALDSLIQGFNPGRVGMNR